MFDDFVGIFDNVLTKEECAPIIQYFDELRSLNLVYTRQDLKDGAPHHKSDETAFVLQHDTIVTYKKNPVLHTFLENFWKCYEQYVSEYSILADSGVHGINSIRIQKTLPGQGYHSWHYESSDGAVASRLIAWSLYLNDIDLGGETEFLYLKRRINAKAGRLVIWPAGFTHTHRGNPPLSNDKYILTGWLEFMGKV
jgi:hypothetical protein